MSVIPVRSLALAGLSGGLLAVAFPGTGDQGWLALGALAPLLAAIDRTTWRHAAVLGFVAGLVFWLATLAWVVPTMVRYGGLPWPLATLILLGLAGYLSLYWAVFGGLLARTPLRSGAMYVVVAASLWVALEFLRTYLLTGFPWNLLGYSQYRTLPLLQVAAVTGVYGVSFVVAAANAAVARLVGQAGTWRQPLAAIGTAGLVAGLAIGSGWLWPPLAGQAPAIRVVIVQGNIDQGVKWNAAWQGRTVDVYGRLTQGAPGERPQLIVWPETAVPFMLREDPRRREIQALARDQDAYLLAGAPHRHDGQPRNSAFLIGPDGRLLGRYDKRHLVPFGEYVPMRRLLFFVSALAGGAIGEFGAGSEATVFATPVGRVGVVICYEAIFPGEVRDFFRGGAEVLVNITNDAWFGRSAAPAQHLAMAVVRAVENRAYLLRAANTGISAIVAPDGRVVTSSGLFTPAVLTGVVTRRGALSPYTRYGDVFAWAAVAVALAAVLAGLMPAESVRRELDRGAGGERALAWRRRGVLFSVPIGGVALVAGLLAALRSSPVDGRGYRQVARWRMPEGEGWFIVVGPSPTPGELRALGERLRAEFRDLPNAVVMVFDDEGAARQARRGSRLIGEERFQAALAHQRAVYLKHADRREHSLTIYDRYPGFPREVVRY